MSSGEVLYCFAALRESFRQGCMLMQPQRYASAAGRAEVE
jgi:hypothetical protein